jgi:hypothetical protein
VTSATSGSAATRCSIACTRARPAALVGEAFSIRTITLASRKPAASARLSAITLSVAGSSAP